MIPYVICHMTTSVDGKVTGNLLYPPEAVPATDLYYEINRRYAADAYACGRITMEGPLCLHGHRPKAFKHRQAADTL